MLLRDLAFYRTLLRRLPLGELLALYERTAPEYAALAQAIAEELTARLSGRAPLG
jgi:hypothetical protein